MTEKTRNAKGKSENMTKQAKMIRWCTVKDLNEREDLQFISDSQDVEQIKKDLNIKDYDTIHSFFVKVQDGEYKEVYGIGGIIPYLDKTVYKIEQA